VKEGNYHEFTELPAWTRVEWKDGKIVNVADPYKWGGDQEPPTIGSKVRVYMNSIGDGKVVGYFAEYGFLGVLVRPAKAPAWYVKQNGRYALAHIFGIELQPFRKKAEA
jgi:hypothetical protein